VSTSYQFLTVERHGGVERVTLNRPDVRNAFNEHVIADLTAWARQAHADPPRVVVFAGAGKVFSAGADAGWMAKMASYSREDNLRDARAGAEMFLAINTVPAIVIGRIHGAALGGGSGLAAVPIAPSSLQIGTTSAASPSAGDVWPTNVGFASALPSVAPGRYTATLTFTVIGR